jgi:hypothetical protein
MAPHNAILYNPGLLQFPFYIFRASADCIFIIQILDTMLGLFHQLMCRETKAEKKKSMPLIHTKETRWNSHVMRGSDSAVV